ncbi:hypothetical protein [Stenotrophomonas hibiscicola]|uniref:hypothetical protein n=1 Tax=Stenotrophomonas hibiscicola TaxID=86189 RepID=UPI003209F88C
MDWVALARTLATEVHAGQMDKAGQPYIGHVARVAAAVRGDGRAPALQVRARPGSAGHLTRPQGQRGAAYH